MEDLNDKINGGTLDAAEWNQVPSEIQNIIEQLGQTLSGADLNQLGKGISGYVANGTFYTDSGAVNTYVLTGIGSKQSPTAYTDGMQARFIPSVTNTGASTVNVAGLGVVDINQSDGTTAIIAGELVAGEEFSLSHRLSPGAHFVIVKSDLSSKADVNSPTLTGTPAAPTATPGTSTTQIATTEFATLADDLKANKANAALTGIPTAPTATPSTNNTQIASTAYADAAVALKANKNNAALTGTPTTPTAAPGTDNTQIASTAYADATITNLVAGDIPDLPASKTTSGIFDAARIPAATTSVAGAVIKPTFSNATNGYEWNKETGYIRMWGTLGSVSNNTWNSITLPSITGGTLNNIRVAHCNLVGDGTTTVTLGSNAPCAVSFTPTTLKLWKGDGNPNVLVWSIDGAAS